MPLESQQVDEMIEGSHSPEKFHKSTLDDITEGFTEIPVFEPVDKTANHTKGNGKKSLNEKLKSEGFAIGLNDKLAFIKHLFNGKDEDYERILSQLNTATSFKEAKILIQEIVKPDYDGWKGKEEYEERLMEIIEGRFD
jgi:hypothetical protein